eukprot:gene1355-32717_t
MAFVKPSPMRTLTIAPQQQRSVTVGIFRKKTPAAVEKAEPKKVAKKTERNQDFDAGLGRLCGPCKRAPWLTQSSNGHDGRYTDVGLSEMRARSSSCSVLAEPRGSSCRSRKSGWGSVDVRYLMESIAAPTMNALNFSTYVSKKDQQLLDEAKYGELEGGKMSREQYGALRRKVGGTAKDFVISMDFVEKSPVKLPAYYKPSEGPQVPFLPILVGILIAVLGTTALLFAK